MQRTERIIKASFCERCDPLAASVMCLWPLAGAAEPLRRRPSPPLAPAQPAVGPTRPSRSLGTRAACFAQSRSRMDNVQLKLLLHQENLCFFNIRQKSSDIFARRSRDLHQSHRQRHSANISCWPSSCLLTLCPFDGTSSPC